MTVFATDDESDATPERRFERLVALPPSSKLVYKVLAEDAPLTQRGIRERALLPARTTRDALTRLEAAGLVEERPYAADARKRLYEPLSVTNPEEVERPERA